MNSQMQQAATRAGWELPEILLVPVDSGVKKGPVSLDALSVAAREAAAIWNRAGEGCDLPQLIIGTSSDLRLPTARDGVNTLRVRAQRWCPEDAEMDLECYSDDLFATTHIFIEPHHDSADGNAIVDADIELNAASKDWPLPSQKEDLQAVLLHEFGHVLGLDHPCGFGRDCAQVKSSIMYPDPLEPGRAKVLLPDTSSIGELCRLYGGNRVGVAEPDNQAGLLFPMGKAAMGWVSLLSTGALLVGLLIAYRRRFRQARAPGGRRKQER